MDPWEWIVVFLTVGGCIIIVATALALAIVIVASAVNTLSPKGKK